MRDKKYTQGPWTVDEACLLDFRNTLAVYHNPNEFHTIEVVESPDLPHGECIHGKTDEQRKANAHLIAAAPELLEALEWLIDATIKAVNNKPIRDLDERMLFIDKVVAKSYGETP